MITGNDVLVTRQRLGLSRTKFAALLGPPMTPTKVSNIEHGRAIRPEELVVLAPHVTSTTQQPAITSIAASSTNDQANTISPPSTILDAQPTAFPSSIFLFDEEEELILLDSTVQMEKTSPIFSEPSIATAPLAPPAGEPAGAVASSPSVTYSPVASPVQPESAALFTTLGPGEAAVVSTAPIDAVTSSTAPIIASQTQAANGAVGVEALYQNGMRRVSNSELQSFKRCRRQWWLAWYRGLKLKLERHTGALAIGDRIHRALALYYVPPELTPTDPREALEHEIAQDEVRVLQSVADREATDAAEVMVAFKQDADLARAMIEGYVQWLAETGADQGYRVLAPEQVLYVVIPMSGEYPDMLLAGRLDLRLIREHDGVVLFLDHKTTGSFEKLTRMLVWDEQMKHYHVLEEGNRTPQSPPVEGALYNMLRKVKRSQTANPPFYQRVEIRHNPSELDRFRTRLIGEYEDLQLTERRLNVGADHQRVAYPTPGDHCLWGCNYASICPMFDDNSRVEDFITEHYVQVNPLDRYDDATT